jgi:hypothetical protein
VDQQQLEQIIRAITEEILGYLGTENSVDLCGLEIDSLICPGCDQRCAERCARKTRKVVEAGAARISAGAEVGPIEADPGMSRRPPKFCAAAPSWSALWSDFRWARRCRK